MNFIKVTSVLNNEKFLINLDFVQCIEICEENCILFIGRWKEDKVKGYKVKESLQQIEEKINNISKDGT